MAQWVTINGQTQKMMSIFCTGCSDVKMIPARRGRPPKYCPSCTNAPEKLAVYESVENIEQRTSERERAEKRIDNLTIMLKARGTHISQHRDEW